VLNSDPDKILDDFKAIVRVIARSAVCSSITIDLEDLIQIGNIALLRAVRGYNPSYGSSFEAYAKRCIRTAIYNEAARFLGVFTVDHRTTEAAAEATRMHKSGLDDETISDHLSRATRRTYTPEHILDLRTAYARRHVSTTVTENDAEYFDIRSIHELLKGIPKNPLEELVLSDRILGNRSVQDIARNMDVSESTVYRAENALRIRIEKAILDG
jgi:RNA polymerase sigma factor (sigma-70 family)